MPNLSGRMCADKTGGSTEKQIVTHTHRHRHTPHTSLLLEFVCLWGHNLEAITNLISGMFARFSGDICLLAECGEWDLSRVNKATDILVWYDPPLHTSFQKKKKNISRTGQSTWESYSVLAPRLSLSECNLTSPKTINNLSVFQSIIHFSAVQRAHDRNNSCHQQLAKYDGVGDVV